MKSTTTSRAAPLPLVLEDLGLPIERSHEDDARRVLDTAIDRETFAFLSSRAHGLDVTEELRAVVRYFKTASGHTPEGFRRELHLGADGVLRVDLQRDIGYGADGRLRPTNVLYSADSADPGEVAPIAPFISNLTCNPGIIYDLFINNPSANIGGKYKNRDEVMAELGRILGPGCDISVELNNPFEEDFSKLLDEAAKFREILSPWRVVIKVPHTGPVNGANAHRLLEGDRRLGVRYTRGATADLLRGHNLALRLREAGYRVNFTLMFEPYQTQMALQAKPYFINSFVRHRRMQTHRLAGFVAGYEASGDEEFLRMLRSYMVETDYLGSEDDGVTPLEALLMARDVLRTRDADGSEGPGDGLDAVRHNLRALRNANLPETRLIVCSMEGERNYPDIDRLLADPEFADMSRRIVVTAEPHYLARFTSTNQVVTYQRRFLNAANGES
jgi:hypothetical protein